MNIQELIENGKEAIQIERALTEERRREAEEQERREQERETAELHQALMKTVPEILRPFVDLSAIELQPYALDRSFPVRIEGCTEIRVRCVRRGRRDDDTWQLAGYIVYLPIKNQHPDSFEVDWEGMRFGSDDLEKVVGTAALAFERGQQMQAKLDVQRAKCEAQRAAWAREQENREMELECERAQERDEREAEFERMLGIVRQDPMALALLRAFIIAREDSGRLKARLSSMDDMVSSIERRYQERLETAQREAQSVADQARDLERRAWDAEEKARKLEKEAKRAERGW